jgi:pilus assembly protein Flp/PilA
MREFYGRLHGDRRGATAIEYGLILALIAIAAAGTIGLFADAAMDMWEYVRSNAVANM